MHIPEIHIFPRMGVRMKSNNTTRRLNGKNRPHFFVECRTDFFSIEKISHFRCHIGRQAGSKPALNTHCRWVYLSVRKRDH